MALQTVPTLQTLFGAVASSERMLASSWGLPNFTGAFVGVACQDLAGTAIPADFDWFEYREREYVPDISRLEL